MTTSVQGIKVDSNLFAIQKKCAKLYNECNEMNEACKENCNKFPFVCEPYKTVCVCLCICE